MKVFRVREKTWKRRDRELKWEFEAGVHLSQCYL